jgi:prophage regulatory protein
MRVLRKAELFAKIQLSDVSVWRLERAGLFPRRIQLGSNSVGWFESEIDDWLEKKSAERFDVRQEKIFVQDKA